MERERLTSLLKAPGHVAREDLADLRSLTERFPWFSAAQVLRAGGEQRSGDVLSDETLSTVAAHVPSRAVLFDLTKRSAPLEHTPRPITAITPSPLGSEAHAVLSADAPASEAGPSSSTPPPPEEPLPSVTEEDPLERQIVESALASAYDLTLHAPPPAPIKAQPPPRTVSEAAPSATPRATPSRKRFTAWLAPMDEPPSLPTKTTTPKGTSAPVITPAPPTMDSGALVDRFIRQETPPPARKTAFFTPQQAAKRSLDDSAGLVTETLARIHAKQGNTAQAIETYRKLALKYPGKSAYFAALAKSLEDSQNK